jgi:hypothetical protein
VLIAEFARPARHPQLGHDHVGVNSVLFDIYWRIAKPAPMSRRTVADLCRRCVAEGFLDLQNESRKGRSYRLGPAYERLIAPAE